MWNSENVYQSKRKDKLIHQKVQVIVNCTMPSPLVNDGWPISKLRETLSSYTGIPPQGQLLLCNGCYLDHQQLVRYYRLKDRNMVLAILCVQGGSPPSLNSNQSERIITNFDRSEPEWSRIDKGLNLTGRCDKSDCKAYGKMVWSQKGIGEFDLNRECYNSTCPVCKTEIKGVKKLDFLIAYMEYLDVDL